MRRHFPFLLGRLPRIMIALAVRLVTFGRRFLVEILLAVPFVALFLILVVRLWGDDFIFAQLFAIAVAVLPLSYLVLCLMVRPRQSEPHLTPGESAAGDTGRSPR